METVDLSAVPFGRTLGQNAIPFNRSTCVG
jgi:hypothetical protein